MVHESFATTALVGELAVEQSCRALLGEAPVICDATMVVAGIPSVVATNPVHCYLREVPQPAGDGAVGGRETRSALARSTWPQPTIPTGAIWVIGNAPTALTRLLDLHEMGLILPAAVLGLPVGYVGAAEAKLRLWSLRPPPRLDHQRRPARWQRRRGRRHQRDRPLGAAMIGRAPQAALFGRLPSGASLQAAPGHDGSTAASTATRSSGRDDTKRSVSPETGCSSDSAAAWRNGRPCGSGRHRSEARPP